MGTKFSKFKSRVKDVIVDGIQGTLGYTHLALTAGAVGTERVEASLLKRAYAQDPKRTISDRRNISLRRRHKVAQSYGDIRDSFLDFITPNRPEDVAIEAEVHGNA